MMEIRRTLELQYRRCSIVIPGGRAMTSQLPSPATIKSNAANSASEHRPVVIIPTYNNAGTLPEVLTAIDSLELPIIVVNDGSADATSVSLAQWHSRRRDDSTRYPITHEINRGKAAALLTGFAAARARNFTHAITIDADGQHDPADIPALLDAARQHPTALIIGCRDDTADDYPFLSRFGRAFSDLMLRFECGQWIEDSQSGFRVYPLTLLDRIHTRSSNYAMETEVIALAAWAGAPILHRPIRCQYVFSNGERCVSHYRVGRETWQALRLHVHLLVRRVFRQPSRLMEVSSRPPAAQTTPRQAAH
jgi:hypothetical protein